MDLKLISHVNGDSDLIEAWLKYYRRLGVEHFHLILHGPPEENEHLLSFKDSFPIVIEDEYEGAFECEQKKNRLDALLARFTDQWIILVDSDEFVEFPYRSIPDTIQALGRAGANLMAAPMLQRITIDGSLDSPLVIEDPFEVFPLCSVDLYRRVGIKAEIFKFPLFFCTSGMTLLEEGNHNPPLGNEPREANILGVTHHFKFRRTAPQRLARRINSSHPFRQESLELRKYLERHGDRLPLDGTFGYSRTELFRRGLLKAVSEYQEQQPAAQIPSHKPFAVAPEAHHRSDQTSSSSRNVAMFVISPSNGNQDFSGYIDQVLSSLSKVGMYRILVCLDRDSTIVYQGNESEADSEILDWSERRSFFNWLRMIRTAKPERIVFCCSWIEALPWKIGIAAWAAGVRKRFAIQYMMPVAVPRPPSVSSPSSLARRLLGRRARRLARIRISAWTWGKTICVSSTVRDALVHWYRFSAKKTLSIHEGVSTAEFRPCERMGGELRARLGIGLDDFVLVCAASLTEDRGIEVLIHALSRVLRQGIQCKCIIVGGGPLRERLIQKANSLGLFNFVFFEKGHDDLRQFLQAGSAFILLSFWEGLPASVLKAMACGLPCIVTNVGGISEAVRDKSTGLVVPTGSVDATAEAIEYLATHPCERAAMGRQARETVCREFELESRIEALRSVLVS